jgi:hypothetical protein
MAIRLLSLATLIAGAGLSVLFYALLPMARGVRCAVEPCPPLLEFQHLWQSALPLAAAVWWVGIAWLVNKRHSTLARLLLAVPLVLAVTWVAAIFTAAMLG